MAFTQAFLADPCSFLASFSKESQYSMEVLSCVLKEDLAIPNLGKNLLRSCKLWLL